MVEILGCYEGRFHLSHISQGAAFLRKAHFLESYLQGGHNFQGRQCCKENRPMFPKKQILKPLICFIQFID